MSETEVVPDEFRCNRSDGKQWRCKKRALEGRKMCESHHSQQNRIKNKKKVTDSRSRNPGGDEAAAMSSEEEEEEIRVKRLGKSKRKRVMCEAEALDDAVKKMKLKKGDLQLDLIRMVLKREDEKKKKNKKKRVLLPNKNKRKKKESHCNNNGFDGFVGEEITRVLPNGIMAISPPSPTTSNVSSPCDVKVGQEPVSITKRRFRSKNIEPMPVGKMQVVPFKGNLVNGRKEKKKKRCHWCGTKEFEDLISCLSCEREFFCLVCIEKRNKGSKEEVEKKCPVCRGSCRCKVCSVTLSGVTECKV